MVTIRRGFTLFITSASALLFATGAAKFVSAATGGEVLETFDPIFGITLRDLFWLVGSIEIVVALACLCGRNVRLQANLVLSLGMGFTAYRLVSKMIGGPEYCSCLGTITGYLNISPGTANSAMLFILGYLLVGSIATLVLLNRSAFDDTGRKNMIETSTVH